MKQKEASLNTKKMLAASLKKFMVQKQFSKITVSEIILDCGVNRKTFYYHFEDIYALLKWMLEQEAIEVVKQFDLLIDYKQAILFVMQYVKNNAHILNCAYDSIGRDEMKRFFYNDFIGVMQSVVDEAEATLSFHIQPQYKLFICRFYAEALAGMLISYFKEEQPYDDAQTFTYLSQILCHSLPEVIQQAPREKA